MYGYLDGRFLVRFNYTESYAVRILPNGNRKIFSFLYFGGCFFSYFYTDSFLVKVPQTIVEASDIGDGYVADGFQHDHKDRQP